MYYNGGGYIIVILPLLLVFNILLQNYIYTE